MLGKRAILVFLFLAAWAPADIVRLKDGTTLVGEVKKSTEGWTVYGEGGKSTQVRADQVQSIEFARGAGGADSAAARLASLRRSVENVEDIRQIIQRYRSFIEQNKNSAAAEEANGDLALWQQRLERNLVKVGGKWMSEQERIQLKQRSVLLADQARQFIKDGRPREAESLLREARSSDPSNPSLLYLYGLVQYGQNQFVAARKSFETVAARLPDHAPALNNLAVILWRQNQFGAALAQYERALTAGPLNKDVLNNVAEALHALPDDQKNSAVLQRVTRKFAEQDARLQEQLAAQGLYRWGAKFLNKEQLEAVKQAEKEVREKLDAMAADYAATETQLKTIDARVAGNDKALADMEISSIVYDTQGRMARLPLPPEYYRVSADSESLKAQKPVLQAKLEQLRTSAREMQQRLPAPKYGGIQQLIGIEGTPLAIEGREGHPVPALPATAPLSEPATAPAMSATQSI